MLWFKRISLGIIIGLALVVLSTIFITWRYEDEIRDYALDAIGSNITSKVSFKDEVKLSIWKDFPLVSVEFSDLYIQDSFLTDTLINVKKAYVQFDLIKVIKGQMTIEGIRISDGLVRVKRNASGNWNFMVWKSEETQDSDHKTDLSIEILRLDRTLVDYDDQISDLGIQFYSEKSTLKGRFTDENTRLALNLKGIMNRLLTADADRVVDLPMTLTGSLNINSKDKIYNIETANAVLAGNEMILDAEWSTQENETPFQLRLHASKIKPFDLLPHVWPQMPENLRKLALKGQADLDLSLIGPFSQTQGPKLDAIIKLRNGGLLFQDVRVSDLNFEGKLHMQDIKRSKALQIDFDSFELKTPSGHLSGSGVLTDLSNPRLKLKTTGTSRLEEIVAVAKIKEDVDAGGNISWDINFEGPLGPDFNTTVAELKQMQWSGKLTLSDAYAKFNGGIPKIENLKAEVTIKSGNTAIQNCSGKIGHLDFEGEVLIAALKEILSDPGFKVELTGAVHIKEIDIKKLPDEWQFSSKSEDAKNTTVRPVFMNVKTIIDKVIFNDFSATNVSGSMNIQNELLIVSDLQFRALDGHVSANLSYKPTTTGSLLDLNAKLRNIDISRTLAEWNDFGQKSITSKNLKGRTSAILNAQIPLDKNNAILKEKLKVETDIEITGGELIQFEPLLAMSKFISVDELNHVRFDTIRNQLTIKDNRIFIPKMMVSSSILNVQVFGEHGFDQEMDYHVNLLLNDLLRRKAKKKESFDGHEIIDERGKTRLFLWIRGKPGSLKVGFDKKEVKQKLKEDFKQEGKSIKQLFKDEFSGSGKDKESTKEINFKLEEPDGKTDGKSTPSGTKAEKPKKTKKKGFFNSEKEKEETEGGFEIEFDP